MNFTTKKIIFLLLGNFTILLHGMDHNSNTESFLGLEIDKYSQHLNYTTNDQINYPMQSMIMPNSLPKLINQVVEYGLINPDILPKDKYTYTKEIENCLSNHHTHKNNFLMQFCIMLQINNIVSAKSLDINKIKNKFVQTLTEKFENIKINDSSKNDLSSDYKDKVRRLKKFNTFMTLLLNQINLKKGIWKKFMNELAFQNNKELLLLISKLKEVPNISTELSLLISKLKEAPNTSTELSLLISKLKKAPNTSTELSLLISKLKEVPNTTTELSFHITKLEKVPNTSTENTNLLENVFGGTGNNIFNDNNEYPFVAVKNPFNRNVTKLFKEDCNKEKQSFISLLPTYSEKNSPYHFELYEISGTNKALTQGILRNVLLCGKIDTDNKTISHIVYPMTTDGVIRKLKIEIKYSNYDDLLIYLTSIILNLKVDKKDKTFDCNWHPSLMPEYNCEICRNNCPLNKHYYPLIYFKGMQFKIQDDTTEQKECVTITIPAKKVYIYIPNKDFNKINPNRTYIVSVYNLIKYYLNKTGYSFDQLKLIKDYLNNKYFITGNTYKRIQEIGMSKRAFLFDKNNDTKKFEYNLLSNNKDYFFLPLDKEPIEKNLKKFTFDTSSGSKYLTDNKNNNLTEKEFVSNNQLTNLYLVPCTHLSEPIEHEIKTNNEYEMEGLPPLVED